MQPPPRKVSAGPRGGTGASPGTGTGERDRGRATGSSIGAAGPRPRPVARVGSWGSWAVATGTCSDTGSSGYRSRGRRERRSRALSGAVPQVKLTQELRVQLLEQLSGLQGKQQRDAELLEDIR